MSATDEGGRVDPLEQGRGRLGRNRLGLQLAREMDADILTIRALVDEVANLRVQLRMTEVQRNTRGKHLIRAWAERDAALATIAAVRALHDCVHQCHVGLWFGGADDDEFTSPCPTIRLLDGDGAPE